MPTSTQAIQAIHSKEIINASTAALLNPTEERYKAVSISTSAILPQTFQSIINYHSNMVMRHNDGYFIKLYEELEQNILMCSGSEELLSIIEWAHHSGFRAVAISLDDNDDQCIRIEGAYNAAAISTGHVSEDDSDYIAGTTGVMISRETGLFIKISEELEENVQLFAGCENLLAAIKWAYHAGYRMLELDCDAPVIEGLEEFDW